MITRRIWVLFWTALVMLAGCQSLTSESERAEQRWKAQRIASYRLEVTTISIWHMQTHTITVQADKVVDSSATCTPAPIEGRECKVQPFKPEDFTIPALFAKAGAGSNPKEGTITIQYDPTYGFPTQINYKNPKVIDGDWLWRTGKFEVLP